MPSFEELECESCGHRGGAMSGTGFLIEVRDGEEVFHPLASGGVDIQLAGRGDSRARAMREGRLVREEPYFCGECGLIANRLEVWETSVDWVLLGFGGVICGVWLGVMGLAVWIWGVSFSTLLCPTGLFGVMGVVVLWAGLASLVNHVRAGRNDERRGRMARYAAVDVCEVCRGGMVPFAGGHERLKCRQCGLREMRTVAVGIALLAGKTDTEDKPGEG